MLLVGAGACQIVFACKHDANEDVSMENAIMLLAAMLLHIRTVWVAHSKPDRKSSRSAVRSRESAAVRKIRRNWCESALVG